MAVLPLLQWEKGQALNSGAESTSKTSPHGTFFLIQKELIQSLL